MMDLIVRVVINTAAVVVAVNLVPRIEAPEDLVKLLAIGLILGVINTYIRPIVKALAFPISLLTLGLVGLVINAAMLLLAAFLLGLGLGSAQPLTIMLTYHHAPPGRSGEALGMRLTVNKITQISIPLVFGGIGASFGLFPVFWANAAFLLAGGIVSLKDFRSFGRGRGVT